MERSERSVLVWYVFRQERCNSLSSHFRSCRERDVGIFVGPIIFVCHVHICCSVTVVSKGGNRRRYSQGGWWLLEQRKRSYLRGSCGIVSGDCDWRQLEGVMRRHSVLIWRLVSRRPEEQTDVCGSWFGLASTGEHYSQSMACDSIKQTGSSGAKEQCCFVCRWYNAYWLERSRSRSLC